MDARKAVERAAAAVEAAEAEVTRTREERDAALCDAAASGAPKARIARAAEMSRSHVVGIIEKGAGRARGGDVLARVANSAAAARAARNARREAVAARDAAARYYLEMEARLADPEKNWKFRAGDLDDRELRKAIRRMLTRVEPEVLERKAKRNRRDLLQVGFAEGPVGCSDMYATLPTEAALAIQAAVDEVMRLKPSSSKGRYMQKVTISTTTGPGIPVDPSAISKLLEAGSDSEAS